MARHIDALENVVGVSDMCLLEPLNEENAIKNLKHRFEHEQIYVSRQLHSLMLQYGCV